MVKRKVDWSRNALFDLLEIMNYYTDRNKSKDYSKKLSHDIRYKLKTIDLTVALPQKTTTKNLYYFTHNHVSVCFEILDNDLRVQLIIDERRNPDILKQLLKGM
jgi:hypothetical protein